MSTGKTALSAVIASVMAALAADSTFMAAVPGGVWDYVPADPTWPYVCLDSASEAPADTMGSGAGSQGRRVLLTFAVFSLYQGRTQQLTILDSLARVLRYASPTITGWTHLQTRYIGARAVGLFELGDARAGSTSADVEVWVRDAS
jgi:hypothetical protein